MTDPADTPDLPPSPAPPALPEKKGRPLLAWVVIVLVILFILYLHSKGPRPVEPAAEASTAQRGTVALELLGREAVGSGDMYPANKSLLYRQLGPYNTGPLGQRLRFVVLAGELKGPEEALRQLRELKAQLAKGDVAGDLDEAPLVDVLERLYGDYAGEKLDAPSVREADRQRLRERLGWFGQLALVPPGCPDPQERAAALAPAHQAVAVYLGVLAVGAALGMVGFTALCLFAVLLFSGQLRSGITGPFEYGGVYAETFAAWMVLFVLLSLGASRLPAPPTYRALLAQLLGLAALAWPILRGVPWRQLWQDVGWTAGRNPALEPVIGLGGWIMAIPLLFVGALLSIALIYLNKLLHGGHIAEGLSPTDLPTHPVQGFQHSTWWDLVLLLLIASVAAPVVEETMFRGVLYRHLREATGKWGRAAGILASALLASFLFAVIHPQGWTLVPALTCLAFAFSLVREWRGTLIPCMVAHGVHNGLLMLLFFFVMRG